LSGPPDLLLAVAHWIEYLGLLGGLGSFVVRRLGAQPPRIQWAHPPMELAFATAFLGGLAVVGGEALRSGAVPQWFGVGRVVAEGAALVLCVRGIPAVAPAAALAAVLLPLGGHAAGVLPAGGAELADALHVLSAGMWAGGIVALASLRPPDGWKSPDARRLLDRFAGVALIAFAVTALTGVLRATEQLATLSDLWTTSYGVVLTLKSLGVIVMLALSSLAWRRGLPVARLEAIVAGVVIGLTALLAAYPLQA
jgi:putative copper export protein